MDCFQQAYTQSVEKISRNSRVIGAAFPQAVDAASGAYNREEPHYWTGGFWGGLLWLAYRAHKQEHLFELACEIEEKLDGPLNEFVRMHHDVGFMWLPTAVQHARATGSAAARVRGLKAASILAGRFNLAGRFIRAWESREGSEGFAIIDCLMNLPLLYWASETTGDPRFKHIAAAHADTALRHFVREDATVPHILAFDPQTGEVQGPAHGQGKSLQSVWARGQAWALYGFAISFRETGDARYLEAAARIAERFYQALPSDRVPYWDFLAEGEERAARDSSAACIAASGMLEIAARSPALSERFTGYAKEILHSLHEGYACYDDETQGIIRMGTVNYTAKKCINTPIIYGDFYYLEALGKLQGLPGVF